jgi:hypothetical protein
VAVSAFEEKKATGVPCTKCEGTAEYQFNTKGVIFSFAGDAWADKNYREKKYRKRRASYMSDRQAKSHIRPTLKPNYKGEEADTWVEARDAARDDGKNVASYEPLIHKERAQKRGD